MEEIKPLKIENSILCLVYTFIGSELLIIYTRIMRVNNFYEDFLIFANADGVGLKTFQIFKKLKLIFAYLVSYAIVELRS